MVPLPFAVKVPTRAIKPPCKSVPLISKGYGPFRLAFEKPAWTGGGGVELPPPPPQAAANPIRHIARERGRRFTMHLHRSADRVFRPAPVTGPAWFALLRFDYLFGP